MFDIPQKLFVLRMILAYADKESNIEIKKK
jgi:hypothetical protein